MRWKRIRISNKTYFSLLFGIVVIVLGVNLYLDNKTYLFEDKILASNNIKTENIDCIRYIKNDNEYIVEDKNEVNSIINKLSGIKISNAKEFNVEGKDKIEMYISENNELILYIAIYSQDYISIFKYKTSNEIENYKIEIEVSKWE